MIPDLSHLSSSSRLPRVLIAENSLTTESLIRAFGDWRLRVDCHVCTSHNQAVMNLFHLPARYQLVICSVQLAEIDGFLLLKHNRMVQPLVPFVVTATAAQRSSARRALEQGAFDLITHPVAQEQTLSTIRLALWHSRLRNLIARKETAQDKCGHDMNYPDDWKMEETFSRALAVVEQASSSVGCTSLSIEERTVRIFFDFAMKIEDYARTRALNRLVRHFSQNPIRGMGIANTTSDYRA